MKTWHPKSYSQQARDFVDVMLKYVHTQEDYDWAVNTLFNSYRGPLVKMRATKRFKRKTKNLTF